MKFFAENLTDLPEIAEKILVSTKKRVFLFSGDLGAGKTTFIKEICRILGSEDIVSSPTFSLVNHYKTSSNKDIYHFDFFRLKSPEEASDIGFEEYLDGEGICLIEWPEIILKLIFTEFVEVKITAEGNTRLFNVHL